MVRKVLILLVMGLAISLTISPVVRTVEAASTKEKGARCRDGIDNDGDLLVDGDDPDCTAGVGGTGDSGESERLLVRARVDSAGIAADGNASCNEVALGVTWDYWDTNANDADGVVDAFCGADGGLTSSNLSTGGRWFLFSMNGDVTTNFVPVGTQLRWLVFNWSGPRAGCPALDTALYMSLPAHLRPVINRAACTDNLLISLRADRLFKKNATRQQLDIDIIKAEVGDFFRPVARLEYVNPLFIVRPAPGFGGDGDVAILTTTDPDGGPDVDQAELWMGDTLLGNFNMSLEILARRFVQP